MVSNYFETYAPVVKNSSVRLLMAIAAKEGMIVEKIDIKNAYVNSDLDEKVYMEQPEGIEVGNRGEYVCKLKKSLYGLKQSGNKWNKCLNDVLIRVMGFTRLKSESCIYIKIEDRLRIILAVYVDDILIFGPDRASISGFKSKISEAFDIDDIDECKKVIGINVRCEDDCIVLASVQETKCRWMPPSNRLERCV